MYILKIKGSAKIPDYVQIRDDNFTLIAYFRAENAISSLNKFEFSDNGSSIKKIINEIPYGKIYKINF
ncbi:MAG: fructose-6-phosphate aldolase [Bacteroidetes bacterium]|nr:fructose-6-phosphate aldolase [Bacteroidota bacterium]